MPIKTIDLYTQNILSILSRTCRLYRKFSILIREKSFNIENLTIICVTNNILLLTSSYLHYKIITKDPSYLRHELFFAICPKIFQIVATKSDIQFKQVNFRRFGKKMVGKRVQLRVARYLSFPFKPDSYSRDT